MYMSDGGFGWSVCLLWFLLCTLLAVLAVMICPWVAFCCVVSASECCRVFFLIYSFELLNLICLCVFLPAGCKYPSLCWPLCLGRAACRVLFVLVGVFILGFCLVVG